MIRKLKELRLEMRMRMHIPVADQWQWLSYSDLQSSGAKLANRHVRLPELASSFQVLLY